MSKGCFSLVCISVVFLSLISECPEAHDGGSTRKYKTNNAEKNTDLNNPLYLSQIKDVSPKILSRHKRIKKSLSSTKTLSDPYLSLSDLKAVQKYNGNKKSGNSHLGISGNIKQHGFHPPSKKKPLTLIKKDPYISKSLKTNIPPRKTNNNLKIIKMGKTMSPKKFKRSLSYDDLSGYNYRNGRRLSGGYYRNNRRIKMKGGDKFYSLADAKNELDRRRRLIRKLEKKINYKNKGLAKYATRPYYSDKFLKPTIESIRDKFSTQSMMQLKDPRNHKSYDFDHQQHVSEGGGMKNKFKKNFALGKKLEKNN